MYGGFWKRFVAIFVDGIILWVVGFLFGLVVCLMAAAINLDVPELFFSFLGWGINLAYFVIFESSPLQATPGKMAMGLVVTDVYGQRISVMRALGRELGKIVSGLALCIGYIMAAFTEKKQGLHDYLAKTLVLNKVVWQSMQVHPDVYAQQQQAWAAQSQQSAWPQPQQQGWPNQQPSQPSSPDQPQQQGWPNQP